MRNSNLAWKLVTPSNAQQDSVAYGVLPDGGLNVRNTSRLLVVNGEQHVATFHSRYGERAARPRRLQRETIDCHSGSGAVTPGSVDVLPTDRDARTGSEAAHRADTLTE
jgi:hypothetical protein